MEWRRPRRRCGTRAQEPRVGMGLCLADSMEEAEFDTFLLKSFWKNLLGLDRILFPDLRDFEEVSVVNEVRSFSASAIRVSRTAKSHFKVENSWCRAPQPWPPADGADGIISVRISKRLWSSLDSSANSARMLLVMSPTSSLPDAAAVRTCSCINTCRDHQRSHQFGATYFTVIEHKYRRISNERNSESFQFTSCRISWQTSQYSLTSTWRDWLCMYLYNSSKRQSLILYGMHWCIYRQLSAIHQCADPFLFTLRQLRMFLTKSSLRQWVCMRTRRIC